MEKILSGKLVAQAILEQIKDILGKLSLIPTLALIRVGHDPASVFYVQNIIKQANKLGMHIELTDLPEKIQIDSFIGIIGHLNVNPKINGIMIQKPLPKKISDELINSSINPDKDIDGIHPFNLGKLFLSQAGFVPCTAQAVIELIKHYQIETRGKHVVILGRSPIVSKPLAGLLLNKTDYGNATVTICHSFTQNLVSVIKTADILVTAIGKPNYVTSDMIDRKTILIDVGINLISDIKKGEIYVGDIDYNSCFEKALAITPVPGGIGSITTSVLLRNLLEATMKQGQQKIS